MHATQLDRVNDGIEVTGGLRGSEGVGWYVRPTCQ
jgi:hypothetical protein